MDINLGTVVFSEPFGRGAEGKKSVLEVLEVNVVTSELQLITNNSNLQ